MYNDDIELVAKSAEKKDEFLKENPLGYLLSSILAGAYISIAVIFVAVIGGMIKDFSGSKIIVGMFFSIALSLIYVAGGELYTGNSFVMSIGIIRKKVSMANLLKGLAICYIGNIIGSVIISLMVMISGYLVEGDTAYFLLKVAHSKGSLEPIQIFIRSILCNTLVCLATWCWYRCKSESAKLIMVFWCVSAFFISGFEHSIANMSIFLMSLLSPVNTDITVSMSLINIIIATIGNTIGAVVVLAIPYTIMAREKTKK